jgi:hypothetical protein
MKYAVGAHTDARVFFIAYSYYYLFLVPRELLPIRLKG